MQSRGAAMLWAPPAWNNLGRGKQLFSPGLPLKAENNVSAWATIDIGCSEEVLGGPAPSPHCHREVGHPAAPR